MRLKITNTVFIAAFLLSLILASCVKDLNFDQANDFEISPVIESDLVYFDLNASDFIQSDGSEKLVKTDTTDFRVFTGNFVEDNLQNAELYLDFTNTMSRGFQVKLEFLNQNQTAIVTSTYNIPAAVNSQPVNITGTTALSAAEVTATYKIAVTMIMNPGIPALSNASQGSFIMKSKGTFYMLIDAR